jgi:protein TonB
MDQFLNRLAAQSKPRTGRELAQRALAMARIMAVPEQQDDELKEMTQKFVNARVEPFSVDMYFDALFRKMNKSASMIPNEQRAKGRHIAAVRIVVNQDGSVKSFRVLWAADQQLEIAFIKAVVDQAAPFPVFPQDIRNATDSIVLQICIVPDSDGGGGGATFTRMSQGQACRAR